jgi:hypothetical protein
MANKPNLKIVTPEPAPDLDKALAALSAVTPLWSYIQRGDKEPHAVFMDVSPDIADRLMATNLINRRIKPFEVRTIAKDIKANRWIINGETIKLAKNGRLLDGQNRLTAIIETQATVRSLVVFGLDEDAFATIDIGKARSVSDFVKIHGGQHYLQEAATALLWLHHQNGVYGVPQDKRASKTEAMEFYAKHQAIILQAMQVAVGPGLRRFGASNIAVAYCLLRRVNATEAEIFFDQIATGARLAPDSPILWLREKLTKFEREGGAAWRNWVRLDATLTYWNAWRRKEKLAKHIPETGAFPIKLER